MQTEDLDAGLVGEKGNNQRVLSRNQWSLKTFPLGTIDVEYAVRVVTIVEHAGSW